MPELTAPFVFKNDEKRIVYGPVLVPNEPDADNDVVTVEQIEEVAHKFVEEYGNIDLQHSLNNVGKMIESYILPMDWQISDEITVPKGSWILGVRVTDDGSWQAVKDGKLTGFSIMAISKVAMKSAKTEAEKNAAQKRTTLADLKDGWIVNAVSLVDEPAVPKAKFIAIKSKAKKEKPTITEETVQKAVEGSLEHRKALVRSKVYETFDSETTDSYVHSTLDDSVIIRIEDSISNQSRFVQIGYDIDDQGNVSFTGQPQEVRIQETIVPVQQGKGTEENAVSMNSKAESVLNTFQKSNEGVFTKLMKKLGFQSAEKAGRTISDANYQKLKTAKEVIDELLSIADKERANNSIKEGESEMDENQVKKLIHKELKPIDDKLIELMEIFKSLEVTDGTENNTAPNDDKSERSEKATVTLDGKKVAKQVSGSVVKIKEGDEQEEGEETVPKSEYDKLLEELEKAKKHRPFSKRLAGQDNMTEKNEKPKSDRNAFGYKIN